MQVFINPGAGTARAYGKCSVKSAELNIRRLVADAGLSGLVQVRAAARDKSDGRRRFVLIRLDRPRKRCEVWMPECKLSKVRYRPTTDDNPWDFPRLLVGKYGNSWLWPFALGQVREELGFDDDGIA